MSLVGLGHAGEALSRALGRGRNGPAYLLCGPDEDAARDVAMDVAVLLVAGPGVVPSTALAARVREGRHPDVHLIQRDKPTVISVAAFAEHLERAHSTPREGARQVFIVVPAHAHDPLGIARYLKTLEEPPDRTVFLLVTSRPERLPDAVRSRCQIVHVPPLGVEPLTARLVADGIAPDEAARLAHLAGGSLSRAMRLHEGDVLPALATYLGAATATDSQVVGAAEALAAAVRQAESHWGDLPPGECAAEFLRCLAVDLRDRAVGRSVPGMEELGPAGALEMLARWDDFAGAAASHVPPTPIWVEWGVALRSALRRS